MSIEQLPDGEQAISQRAALREKALQVQARHARARALRVSVIAVVAVLVCAGIAFSVYRAVVEVAEQPVLYPAGLEADGVRITSVTGLVPESVELTKLEPVATEVDVESDDGDVVDEGEDADVTAPEAEPEPASETLKSVVDIHIYVDYRSRGSGDFQRTNSSQLSGWIADGAVTVTYHPVALLNSSSTRYSLRAAAASACVASYTPERFYNFNHDLLVHQQALETEGLNDVELADLAIAVGTDRPKEVRACIEGQHFLVWAKEATARALAGPLPGSDSLALGATPMIVVNGVAYVGSLDNAKEFAQFVLSVASDAYYATVGPTATPSPSPSPTPSSDE